MNTIEEVKQYLQELIDKNPEQFIGEYELSEEFEIEKHGDWVDEGKYFYCEDVYRHLPTSTFWEINNSRSGYFGDYFQNTAKFYQVVPEEVTTIKWRVVE